MTDTGATPDEIFARFESRTNLERTTPQLRLYRLERMVALLERLEQPQNLLPVVHLAGSKGKGSTAAFVTSLLAATGATVGLYTSPHVTDYRERFTVIGPGQAVGSPDERAVRDPRREHILAEQGRRVWSVVEDYLREGVPEDELPTTFELLTALAFCYFSAVGCTWIVLETGLGGRLDATNVCRPAITLITRIELEHTEYLGTTIPAIAGEKAGIIKRGVPLCLAPQVPEADAVFRRVAREREAPIIDVLPLVAAEAARPTGGSVRHDGPVVTLPDWAGGGTAEIPMLGDVHRVNAAMALAAFRRLQQEDRLPATDPAAIRTAVASTRLPGRGEVHGSVILDGAHTAESAAALADTLRRRLPAGDQLVVILGIVAGKNVEAIADAFAPLTPLFIVSRPGRFKPGDPVDVAARIAARGFPVERIEDPADAFARAQSLLDPDGPRPRVRGILVSGSFYMVSEIRRLVLET